MKPAILDNSRQRPSPSTLSGIKAAASFAFTLNWPEIDMTDAHMKISRTKANILLLYFALPDILKLTQMFECCWQVGNHEQRRMNELDQEEAVYQRSKRCYTKRTRTTADVALSCYSPCNIPWKRASNASVCVSIYQHARASPILPL